MKKKKSSHFAALQNLKCHATHTDHISKQVIIFSPKWKEKNKYIYFFLFKLLLRFLLHFLKCKPANNVECVLRMSGWGSVMYCMVIVMTWHAKEEIKKCLFTFLLVDQKNKIAFIYYVHFVSQVVSQVFLLRQQLKSLLLLRNVSSKVVWWGSPFFPSFTSGVTLQPHHYLFNTKLKCKPLQVTLKQTSRESGKQ